MHRHLLRICIALVLVLSLQSVVQSALAPCAGEFLTGREATWQQEYEGYFQNQFTSRQLNPSAIQRILRQMSKRTGQRTALLHLVPTANEIKLLVTTGQATVADCASGVASCSDGYSPRLSPLSGGSTPTVFIVLGKAKNTAEPRVFSPL